MRESIRFRLFTGVSCLIIFFVVLSYSLNSGYLGPYYIAKKENLLLESSREIDKIYQGNPLDISLEIEKLERTKGLNIIILALNDEIKYNTRLRIFNGHTPGREPGPGRDEINLPMVRALFNRQENQKYIIENTKDPRLNTNFLNLAYKLNNEDILLLSTPLAAIEENAAIANQFFIFTGLITILIGTIIIFFYAKRFTSPILELNRIAHRMAKLDFSNKFSVKTNDEIGQLGQSINSLSDQLDKSITDLQDTNKKLVEDIQRERILEEMRKEFVSSVSHELKTPLALIRGYAEGLKLNVNEDEENKNFYCEVIMDEAIKMDRLVKGLLDLSQIESGYFKLEKSIFDVSALVDQVLSKYEPLFKEKGITLQIEKGQDIFINADMVRIEQILVNYINNAINHMDNNKILQISISTKMEKARVSIFNSGSHIPQEALDKIWASFYKIDKARTRSYGGTGLGLSIVRAIQELHHNAFGVENIDRGVVFWFEADLEKPN